MRCLFAGLVWALAPVFFLAAQASPSQWTIPRDDLETAVIGVAEFRYVPARDAPGYAPEQSFLGGSVARLLREKLREIPVHEINGEERTAWLQGITAAEKRTVLKKLDELVTARDALFFPGAGLADSAKRESLEDEIENQRNILRVLDDLPPESIELIAEKKLSLLTEGLTEGLLPPVMDPQAAAAKARVDYLVWGTMREEDAGLVSIAASLYSSRAQLTLFSGEVTGSPGELEGLADRLFSRMAAALTGRAWACLDIATNPPSAYIYVDGELAGIGSARLAYVRPGAYRLSFYADGYEAGEEHIFLEPDSREKKDYALTEAPQASALL
ncbi:MAG: PEGA domain-containing protein, partial [Spirochaetaceae bacterium]|nr:PEGA domain-containing protein [Spirochaetaceae bacterium]